MIAENVGEIHGGLAGELHVDGVARIPIAVPLVGVASIGAQLGDAINGDAGSLIVWMGKC